MSPMSGLDFQVADVFRLSVIIIMTNNYETYLLTVDYQKMSSFELT